MSKALGESMVQSRECGWCDLWWECGSEVGVLKMVGTGGISYGRAPRTPPRVPSTLLSHSKQIP